MKLFLLLAMSAAMTACTRDRVTSSGDTITYAASGCFSGCTPFVVVLEPDGQGTVTQYRHVTPFRARRSQVRTFAAYVDQFRPDHGLEASDGIPNCNHSVTDKQEVQIIWQRTGNMARFVYDYGCLDPDKQRIGVALRLAPSFLPVATLLNKY